MRGEPNKVVDAPHLLVGAETPASEVARLLAILHELGVSEMELIFSRKVAVEKPDGRILEGELDSLTMAAPGDRTDGIAAKLREYLPSCPGLAEGLMGLELGGEASLDELRRAAQACGCDSRLDKARALLWFHRKPDVHTFVRLRLAAGDGATALSWPADARWADVAPAVIEAARKGPVAPPAP